MTSTIALIVDDNSIRQLANAALSEGGYAVLEANANMLQMEASIKDVDAVCLGIADAVRFEWLYMVRAVDASLPIIVITGDEFLADRAARADVYDVLGNTVSGAQLRLAVRRAVQHRRLNGEASELRRRLAQYEGDEVVPIRDLERQAIERALRATRGSVTKAAKLLGIGRATLYRRLASPDMADIRARRNGEPVTPANMSSLSQATMAREP
ncbi:helix-turn-helix domain-containing protein [Haliangium sp.]|uniref:helix-turn-helix domain-containing protein n=1 Tax=Haliangium sp. TaxID=2663208 RepID=UPI003D0C31C4